MLKEWSIEGVTDRLYTVWLAFPYEYSRRKGGKEDRRKVGKQTMTERKKRAKGIKVIFIISLVSWERV